MIVRRSRAKLHPRRSGLVALSSAVALLLAACGGGGKKTPAAVEETTTTTVAEATPTTETTAVAGADVTTTTAAAGRVTTTTSRRTATTVRKTGVTQPAKTVAGVGGIVSVGGTTTTTAGGKPPQPGGTLTQIISSENQGFDPTRMGINGASTDGTSGAALYDALVYNDPFDGQTYPNIAESMTSGDGVIWVLKIRPNVKFSDNTAYDAEAVKYNYLRHQDPATGSIRAGFANQIGTMDVVDPLTLRLTLKATNFLFPRIVATNLGWIASPTALKKGGDYNAAPVGAGPFLLKQWTRGVSVTFTRNPNYWRAPLPYLDQLVLKLITDPSQQVNSFRVGEADIISGVTGDVADQASKVPSSKIVSLELLAGANVEFNTQKAPFNDVKLRQAMTKALDRAAYAKQFNQPRAQNSVMPPTSPYYDPNVLQFPYDDKKALKDYVAANGGLSFTLGYVSNPQSQTQAEYLQAVFKDAGANVTLQPGTLQVAISKLTSGDYQAYQFGGTYNDPDPWVQNFLCNSRPAPNVVGFCDTKFDGHAAAGRSSQDVATRVREYREAQKIIYDQVPIMYYEPGLNFFALRGSLQAVRQFENGAIFYGDLWIER